MLVLNLLVLAGGVGLQYVMANRMPGMLEINPGKIRFWSQPEPYKPGSAGSPVQSDSHPVAETSAAVEAKAQDEAADQQQATAHKLCVVIDDLNQSRYQEMLKVLKTSGAADGECSYAFDKSLGWWVYWPPEYETAKRADVLDKIRSAGVKDVLPIREGAMAQSFSVGAFKLEGQARLYRDQLRSKGLDKIEYGPRPSINKAMLSCELADEPQLQKLRTALPSWAKQSALESCKAP